MRQRRRNTTGGFCFPGYRYCGPGCSGPGAPVNEVDRCCQFHDACYDRFGPSKYCDDMFQQCLSRHRYARTKMGKDARVFSAAVRVKNLFN